MRAAGVGGLLVAVGDAALGADAAVEEQLQDLALGKRGAGADAAWGSSASCCAPRPARAAAPGPGVGEQRGW